LIGKEEPIYAVFGGYHLATGDASLVESTVRDLKQLDVKMLLPGHCSGWRVKCEIEKQLPGRLVPPSVGARLKF
jgi:7,8-dihydropterin-6-yl-methyl-4-(beta-D-ribofuranosyl)aminobenzene 5'-phosphate synthase